MKRKILIFALILLSLPVALAADANFHDGNQVVISDTNPTNIVNLSTSLPAGDNLIIAIFQFNATSATNINADNLRIVRGTTVLASNQYQIRAGGGTGKERVSMMLLANDTGAPANAIYNLTAQADVAGSMGEGKIAVISGVPWSYQNGTSVALSTTPARVLSHRSDVAAGNNAIIAVVQIDNDATETRNIAPGRLNLTRDGTVLASNGINIAIERDDGVTRDMGILFVANDTDAPANPEYNITATADGTNMNAKAWIMVINDVLAPVADSIPTAVTAAETQTGLLSTSFGPGKTLVIASAEFNSTATATRTIAAGDEKLKTGTTVQASNEFGMTLGEIGSGFDYRTHGLMWLDTTGGTTAYIMTAQADDTDMYADNEILALRLTVEMKANGTITGPATILTGKNTMFTGSCESNDGNARNVYIILQNSTDNVTFSTITDDNTQPVYANVTNYAIGTLGTNSSRFAFQVNATKPRNYTIRVQCNSTNAVPLTNTTGANLTVDQAFGYLNASLLDPPPGAIVNVVVNSNFTLMANVSCMSTDDNPTAICDEVNGTARYNETGPLPDIQMLMAQGSKPLRALEGNKTCGQLNYSNYCALNWTVNATGDPVTNATIDVLFASNQSAVLQNATNYTNITIINCVVDFTLQWATISWQNNPGSANPASGNDNNEYNITINPLSCLLDLYIRGSDLENTTLGKSIGAGNVTWSNTINSYAASANLSDTKTLIKESVQSNTNVTTWYWINIPAVFAGRYNGTIGITGVEVGQTP
jgi:hypothetical protein